MQPPHRNHHHTGSGAELMEEEFQQNPMIRCGVASTCAAPRLEPSDRLRTGPLALDCAFWVVTLLQMRLCVRPVRVVFRVMSAAVPGAVTAAPVVAAHPQQPPQQRNLMALPSGAAS